MMKNRAFVTGATGFVGGALVERLAELGWDLVALVRGGSQCDRLKALGVTLVSGDLSDRDSYSGALKGCNTVFHCAGLTGMGHSIAALDKVIADGTSDLLGEAVDAGVTDFIYVSSILVYELSSSKSIYDESQPTITSSIDPYALAKVKAERICLLAHEQKDISICIVRPGFIYGPGDRKGGFLPETAAMLANQKFRFVGGGKNSIPLIYITDLVNLLVLCAETDQSRGQIYNACSEPFPSWKGFIKTLCDGLGLELPKTVSPRLVLLFAGFFEFLAKYRFIRSIPLSKPAVKLLSFDVSFPSAKAVQQLGYKPCVHFQEGLANSIPMLKEILKA